MLRLAADPGPLNNTLHVLTRSRDEQIRHGSYRNLFPGIYDWLHSLGERSGSVGAAGNRIRTDGHGVRRRPYLRGTLQPRGDTGSMAEGEMRSQGRCAVHGLADYRFHSCRVSGEILEKRGHGHDHELEYAARSAGGVSIYVCVGVCGAEYGHGEGYSGQFLLWAGDRLYGDVRSFRGRKHFRRSVQSSGGGWDFRDGVGGLAEHLGLLA